MFCLIVKFFFQLLSAILYVKGKVYEAMDNRAVAIDCYKRSLHHDVYSYQAFEALVQNQMLSATEGFKVSFIIRTLFNLLLNM